MDASAEALFPLGRNSRRILPYLAVAALSLPFGPPAIAAVPQAPTLPAISRTTSLDVPFIVKSIMGTDAPGFPVSVGIPLPLGAFREVDELGIADAAGKAVPAQFSVLNRWWGRGDSIRHVLVHFRPNVPSVAGGIARYRLVSSRAAAPPVTPVLVTEAPDRITVHTGPLRFTVRRKAGFTLIDELWLDRNGDGRFAGDEQAIAPNRANGGVLVPAGTLATGVQQDSSREDVEVVVEERGPLRAVIRAEAKTVFRSPTDITHGWAVRIYPSFRTLYAELAYNST